MRIIQLKKIVTGIVAAFVLFSSSAAFACNDSNAKIGENGLVSIEVIPNEEADKLLPECLQEAIGLLSEEGVQPYGQDRPETSSTWNLGSKGKFSFSVNTEGTTIYSPYVFTGHNGSVTVYLNETYSKSSGKYTFKLYKRNSIFDTTLYTYEFDHGAEQTIEMNNFDKDDLIYISVTPNKKTVLSSDSYIE